MISKYRAVVFIDTGLRDTTEGMGEGGKHKARWKQHRAFANHCCAGLAAHPVDLISMLLRIIDIRQTYWPDSLAFSHPIFQGFQNLNRCNPSSDRSVLFFSESGRFER